MPSCNSTLAVSPEIHLKPALTCSRDESLSGPHPHPPPKFAVFHKKLAGNPTLKVRPILSAADELDKQLINAQSPPETANSNTRRFRLRKFAG